MKRLFVLIMFISLWITQAKASEQIYPWLIVPGKSVGKITKASTEKDLERIYGKNNVKEAPFDIGEGEFVPGVILFPNDPSKTLSLRWKDPEHKRFPKEIEIDHNPTLWKTSQGITIGTNLKDLEKLNGRNFKLSGFEWDYAGTVTSWENGRLASLNKGESRLWLRLNPSSGSDASEEAPVIGDGEYYSSNKVMQKVNPEIYQILINFDNGKR